MSEVPSIRLEGLFGEIPLRSSGDFAVAADIEVPECEGLARAPLIVCVDLPSLGETALRARPSHSGTSMSAATAKSPDERSGISPKRPSSRMEGTSDMRAAQDFTTSGLRTLYKRR